MRRFTRGLAVATLAVMLGAAFSAQADYWDWVGKGAGETSFFDDKGCWFQSGSNTDLAKNNHNFSTARKPFTQGWDYRVTFRATTSLTGAVNVEYAGRPVVFAAQNDGNGVSSTAQLNINSGAEFQIESGTYRFSYFQMGNKKCRNAHDERRRIEGYEQLFANWRGRQWHGNGDDRDGRLVRQS